VRLSQGNYNENSGGSEELILLVADLFHVVQLAVKITGDERRRVMREKHGATCVINPPLMATAHVLAAQSHVRLALD